jgi:hypothetical protein
MLKKIFITLVIGMLLLPGTIGAKADGPDLGFSWKSHNAPFTFKFYNLIDNHQQTRLLSNGWLQGFIYIQFTGEMMDGVPVARRANCDDPSLDCRVGWEIIGIPVQGATLVQKGPRLWSFAVEALPSDPEFIHFHWVGDPKKPCGLVLNEVPYSGYLFKRTAVTTFYWLGGNDDKEVGRLVTPGLDMHSNLEGRWAGGGHDGGGGGEDAGSCGDHETGEDTGCGGSDIGGETGGCGDHETGGDTGGDTGCSGDGMGGETGGCDGV